MIEKRKRNKYLLLSISIILLRLDMKIILNSTNNDFLEYEQLMSKNKMLIHHTYMTEICTSLMFYNKNVCGKSN